MAVVYLEPEDEITGAVARLRAMSGGEVVIVVPAGSRIATSRINFRLLARVASEREIRLATVSDEPSVRALSVAAEVPAYESVDAAEAALGGVLEPAVPATGNLVPVEPAPPPARTPERARPAQSVESPTAVMPAVTPSPTEPAVAPVASGIEQAAGGAGRRARRRLSVEPPLYDPGQVAVRRRRGPRRSIVAPLAAALMLLILASLGLYAAYLFLPTATITLRPKLIDVGPASAIVTADPRVAVVDTVAGLIPAQEIEIPLMASGMFDATGTVVTLTAASGRVRFSSQNTFVEVPVPAGTVVSTNNGVEFETTDPVTVPRADFGTQTPGTVMADVVARQRGARGNVGSGAIRRLPESLASALISVRNPQPTNGGSRREQRVVTVDDYEGALAQLSRQLPPKLTASLADPASTPRGLTLYPATATLGTPQPDRLATDVVDTEAEAFELSVTATATVLAVNEKLVAEVAHDKLDDVVPAGTTLLPGTVTIAHPPGVVRGGTIVFNTSAVGRSWRVPDTDALVASVSGLTVVEARTIMERYGSVEISIWPNFIDRLPDANRIRLTVSQPQESP